MFDSAALGVLCASAVNAYAFIDPTRAIIQGFTESA